MCLTKLLTNKNLLLFLRTKFGFWIHFLGDLLCCWTGKRTYMRNVFYSFFSYLNILCLDQLSDMWHLLIFTIWLIYLALQKQTHQSLIVYSLIIELEIVESIFTTWIKHNKRLMLQIKDISMKFEYTKDDLGFNQ